MPPNYGTVEERSGAEERRMGQPDHMIDMAPLQTTSALRRESFLQEFATSNGPPQIVLLCMLLALGFGSTIGVVPAVMTDRYARLNHGYDGVKDCADYSMADKPGDCLLGSADAQNAVALAGLVSNGLTFFSSSLIGSISDEHGRKGILLLGTIVSFLSPLSLVMLQIFPEMNPLWYYSAGALTGLVSWIGVALSALSDVMPPKWRAPSFGLLLAGFSLGFAVAPQLALLLGHFRVSVMSLILVVVAVLNIAFFFPETLPPERALEARTKRLEMMEEMKDLQGGPGGKALWFMYRPLWELSILNRNRLFRLLSLLAFFSGLVTAGDQTLLVYYLEERLEFNDKDIALLFVIMGVLGIFVQAVVLKFVNEAIGERRVVMVSFALGSVHNIIYGLAERKRDVFIGVIIAAFVGMSFPTISAIKSNNAEESEQGRIQGALFSIKALASATGPLVFRLIYHYTKDGAFFGPGSMFVFASLFYAIAVYCGYLLPPEASSGKHSREPTSSDLAELLMNP